MARWVVYACPHTERKHYAKGMCASCYGGLNFRANHPLKRVPVVRVCHPERQHQAKGMCQPCYQKTMTIRKNERRHNLSGAMAIRYRTITNCDWCGNPFSGMRPHIDHDHTCCSSHERTCGECTRGFVHMECNSHAINYYEWLEKTFGTTDPKLSAYRTRCGVFNGRLRVTNQ
jgi:hypothetical protein